MMEGMPKRKGNDLEANCVFCLQTRERGEEYKTTHGIWFTREEAQRYIDRHPNEFEGLETRVYSMFAKGKLADILDAITEV